MANTLARVCLFGLGGVILAVCAAYFGQGSSSGSVCVLCRLNRHQTRLNGFTRTTYIENECSRWYPEHVEPRHNHIWAWGGCTAELNGFGRRIGYSCGRAGPIWSLSAETQIAVYEHFGDMKSAKTFFRFLAAEEMSDYLFPEDDENRGRLIVRELRKWEQAGFPGTWDTWWNRFTIEHLAEHRRLLEQIERERSASSGATEAKASMQEDTWRGASLAGSPDR